MHNTSIQTADALCQAPVTNRSAPCRAHLPLSLGLLSAAITVWQQLQDDICWFASTLQQRTNVPCKTANNTGRDWKSASRMICVTECCQRLTTGQQKRRSDIKIEQYSTTHKAHLRSRQKPPPCQQASLAQHAQPSDSPRCCAALQCGPCGGSRLQALSGGCGLACGKYVGFQHDRRCCDCCTHSKTSWHAGTARRTTGSVNGHTMSWALWHQVRAQAPHKDRNAGSRTRAISSNGERCPPLGNSLLLGGADVFGLCATAPGGRVLAAAAARAGLPVERRRLQHCAFRPRRKSALIPLCCAVLRCLCAALASVPALHAAEQVIRKAIEHTDWYNRLQNLSAQSHTWSDGIVHPRAAALAGHRLQHWWLAQRGDGWHALPRLLLGHRRCAAGC